MVRPASKNPRVFLEVKIGDTMPRRIVIELFPKEAPKAAENFRALCTGEFGRGRDTNCVLHYGAGSKIQKIVRGRVIHAGELPGGFRSGSESVYGGGFEESSVSSYKHASAGVVSMLTSSENSNEIKSQFLITLGKVPALDGRNIVVGRVVEGLEVLRAIEEVPVDHADKPRVDVVIVKSGQLSDRPLERTESSTGNDSVAEVPAVELTNVPSSLERRLLELRLKMNKAKHLNNQAVLAEKKRIEDPKAFEKSQRMDGNQVSDSSSLRPEEKRLHESVEYATARRSGARSSEEPEDASIAAMDKRIKDMGFYPDAYAQQKESLGEESFFNPGNVVAHKPSEDAKNRLAESLKKDQEKRSKFSRKRVHDDDAADVEWINEKNKQYSKKLDKAYGSLTAEIKSNLERGTAI